MWLLFGVKLEAYQCEHTGNNGQKTTRMREEKCLEELV